MDPIRICIFLTVLTLFLNLSQTWLDSLGCFARILSVRTEFSSNPLTNAWFRKVYINNLLVWQVKIEKYFICFLAKWSWQVYPGFRASDTIINLKNLLLRGFSPKKIRLILDSSFPIHYFLPQRWVWNAIWVSKYKLWVKNSLRFL